jgi:general stress protein 26
MTPEHSGDDRDFQRLKGLLQGITYAMLTTRAADGTLVSRPMATEEVDPSGELWFFTDARSHKAQSIDMDPEVCIGYAAPDTGRFVSVSGTGLLVRDRERMARLWKPSYRSWFPNGLDDPDLTLLCVKIERVAYWDASAGAMVQLARWVKAVLSWEPQEPAHGEITVRTHR